MIQSCDGQGIVLADQGEKGSRSEASLEYGGFHESWVTTRSVGRKLGAPLSFKNGIFAHPGCAATKRVRTHERLQFTVG